MRKFLISSVVCASTLFGLTTVIPSVYAQTTQSQHKTNSPTEHALQERQAFSQSHRYHSSYYRFNDTKDRSSSHHQPAGSAPDFAQVVTQFLQTVEKYQDSETKSNANKDSFSHATSTSDSTQSDSQIFYAGTDKLNLLTVLQDYQSAAKKDAGAESDFSDAMNAYLQAIPDGASQSGIISKYQKDAATALQDVQAALVDKTQLDNLLPALKNDASKYNTTAMEAVLMRMTKLESDKAKLLEEASTLLNNAANGITASVD